MSDVNALAALVQVKDNGVTRIKPGVAIEGAGPEQRVVLSFRLSDLAKSRKGTKAGQSGLGFKLIDVEFELPDGTAFVLSSSWISISAR
jgi:hypothetical protein